ncbi:hypothetical protein [Streptomyces sp. NPDC057696]|uniref:hypothetical protein n=1 Tax=Streptomyces sp. NPDC057696 TaxID=3346218 RepID=UPI00369B31CF
METAPDGSAQAFQGDSRPVWTELETAALAWLNNERTGLDRYADANTVWLDEPGTPVGALSPL